MPAFVPKTWVNGVDVANAFNLQRYDNWIEQTEGQSPTTLNGSTSGTAKLYQVFQGAFKVCLVRASNFRNGGGSAQTIVLPTAFTDVSWAYTFDMPEYILKNGGSSIMSNIYYLNSIGPGGFGTAGGPSQMTGNLLFHTSGIQ